MRTFPIRRILLAVKASGPRSAAAVLKAGQLAKAYGARVELFHSIEVPPYLDPYSVVGEQPQQLQEQLQKKALRRLEPLARRLRRQGVQASASVALDAPAYDAIIRRALQIKADLIVASHHSQNGAAWLRLTDWELVRLSPIPVLLVKNARRYRRPRLLMALDPMHAFSKPARLDRSILNIGRSLSKAMHGSLYAVHAFPPVPLEILAPGSSTSFVTEQSLRVAQQRAEHNAKVHLDRLLRGVRIAPSRRLLMAAHPIDAIDAAARSSHSAMVVMGAVSRSGLKRLLIGNTAERIINLLNCDVLVVKPAGFHTHVPRLAATVLTFRPVAGF